MMRFLIPIVSLMTFGSLFAAEEIEPVALYEAPHLQLKWQTDFEKARKESIDSKLPLLMIFTGSDWCHACQHFQQSVLTDDAFQENIKAHFVFLNIDFPIHHRLSSQEIVQNQGLKKKFQIEGFPTVVILMPSGDTMMFAGNFPNNPRDCSQMFLKEVEEANRLQTILSHFDKDNLSEDELEGIYNQARLLGKKEAMKLVLQAGFEKNPNTNAFFLKEKYRELQEMGLQDSDAAQKIRQDLLAQDPDNTKGYHLYIAVSDFEALMKQPENKKGTAAATPLLSYLESHGNDDHQNSWRVELMLAHFLRSAGEPQKAVKFAKAAFVKAPDRLKEDIQSSISEMESAHS